MVDLRTCQTLLHRRNYFCNLHMLNVDDKMKPVQSGSVNVGQGERTMRFFRALLEGFAFALGFLLAVPVVAVATRVLASALS